MLTSLFEKSFPVLKTVPKYAALLSTAVASKAFGYMPIATEMGDAELPKEPMIDKKKIDFSGPSANAQLLEQMSQDAAMIKKRGGGMMNMDEMIRPLGYEVGGVVPRSRQQSVMEEEAKPQSGMLSGLMSLIKNIRENAFAPEQREDGGAEYNKIFNFLWKQGFDAQQIDDIIKGRVNQEDVVPERKNLDEKFKG